MKNIRLLFCLILLNFICGCEDLIIKPATSDKNMEDFEAAWNRVNDVYPFLELKKIDWDSIYTIYLSRIEAITGDDFYLVLSDLLAELKDGHAYYKTEGGDKVYPYYPQRHLKDRHAYSPIVVRKYFKSNLFLTESRSAEYGITPDNIGYIFLSDFHDDNLPVEFQAIIQYLRNTKGLIIDIRQKRGGNYNNVLAIVSQFITSALEKPKFYSLGELVPQSHLQPLTGSFIYTNQVVILINGSTFSAGEITTEMLKQLPNVVAVGDTTGGGGVASANNSPLTAPEFKLPSGKIICVGSGYFERYDGLSFEWIGVPPDIRVEQTETDIKNGRDNQLEYAIDFIIRIK